MGGWVGGWVGERERERGVGEREGGPDLGEHAEPDGRGQREEGV